MLLKLFLFISSFMEALACENVVVVLEQSPFSNPRSTLPEKEKKAHIYTYIEKFSKLKLKITAISRQ